MNQEKVLSFYCQTTYISNTKESDKISRLNAHARYIVEIWCLYLAQMDKLSQ